MLSQKNNKVSFVFHPFAEKEINLSKEESLVMCCVRKGERLRACLHGGGGPQVGEVTRLGGVTRLSI